MTHTTVSANAFAAHMDGVIWGIGPTEEAAIADGTDWMSRNGDVDDAQFLKADECTADLAAKVGQCGGQIKWEWSQYGGCRLMQIAE